MCLKIVTHAMTCDVRPVMRHPWGPNSCIVDPFTTPRIRCCSLSISIPSGSLQCPVHECCQVTVRSFSCDCGYTVGYHRYTPATIPSAYTIGTAEVPSRGVWRKLQSPDDFPSTEAHTHSTPSEELQIAQRGLKHAVEQLGQMAIKLTAISRKKELKEQNLKNGAPYEKQVQAAHDKLARAAVTAREVQSAYYTWLQMKEKLERAEHGKVFAVELAV
ncbi:hypothetical protein F5Y03DRAFT_358644 [Xylaria venustula]|nr:hypothetical protein F5Y03DRAFT_358644 [Xylaria venustula]